MKLPKRITKLNENNESIEKQQSPLPFFYSPVIIGAIFKFTIKPIAKERICIMKIF